MHLSIRSKLLLYTLLPVVAVYLVLFVLGVSHIRDRLSADAQRWLVEHARYQAARLALVFAQAPALAEGVGDLTLAEPDQSEALLYAHLIDGLRRTPIASSVGVAYRGFTRGALMRRGEPRGQALGQPDLQHHPETAGWHTHDTALRFYRAIHRHGEQVGAAWVDVQIEDLYAEVERQRSDDTELILRHADASLLRPPHSGSGFALLVATAGHALPVDVVSPIMRRDSDQPSFWAVRTRLPGVPWDVIAMTPTATALAPVQREALLVAFGLFASLLTILFIINVVTRHITRPLATLDASVQQITSGNFAVSPEVDARDELGGLAHAIGRMARHIADREQQLHRAQQVLEERVVERTSALQESNRRLLQQIEETRRTEEALRIASEQAQRANRAKSEFLSNMSHELRTPLHGVLGYTQILRRDASVDPVQRENLDAIERCGQHLLTLINDILDLTKIEAGQMELDIQPTDLRQLLEDVRMIVAQRASSKGLTLELDLAPDLPAGIQTDAVKLKQILLNLLGNAVKFTATGTVTLRAAVAPGQQLAFEVEDTGVGIPVDKIDAIFDAFHQAREGRAVDGTGLGLAINQRLIDLLGGQALTVDSTPERGSRFRFRIPFQPLAGSQTRPSLPAGPDHRLRLRRGDRCRVMVIDAMTENRNLTATLLRTAGCQVTAVANLDAALHSVDEQPLDLALVDVRLPGDAAGLAVSGLRARPAFSAARLVAVVAPALPDVAQLARQAGFDAFLTKPFDERRLLGLIEQLLGISFEPPPAERPAGAPQTDAAWPAAVATQTARRINAAVDMGDIGSLFQLAEELADDPAAPAAEVENLALMARMFDFDGLRALAVRLQQTHSEAG